MRVQRAPGPTVEKSSTLTPSRAGRAGRRSTMASEVLRKPELAARDDVLLDLGSAAADGVDPGEAVPLLRAPAQRPLLRVDAELRAGARDVHHGVGDALGELRGEELVLGRLDRRRLLAHARSGVDEAQPEHARHLTLRRELRHALAQDRI